jgi:hypothetical protein
MIKNKRIRTLFWGLILTMFLLQVSVIAQKEPDLSLIYKEAKNRKGKRPIIIIPGILGSELINSETNEKIWFTISRSDKDDLRLPIALELKLARDKLIPGDIIREVDLKLLPDIKVYQGLINTLENYGGYEEASWESPPADINDKFFVFPYDWRRDNVETAHLLIKKIEKLRIATKQPEAKFNILAHSMGGLISRYAVMYGKADLPGGEPRPNWSGEKYFSKVFMFGTPNEGSVGALKTLLEGRSSLGGDIHLPFVRNLSPLDIATMPSIFQLLPHQRTARFYDEDLNLLKLDLYNIETWRKYRWAIYSDKKYLKDFSEAETGRLEAYFSLVLKRARKFHEAIDAYSSKRLSVGMFIIGSDCKKTLDALIIYKDSKSGEMKTLTKPDSFRNSKDVKITDDQLEKLMIVPGDGSVSRRSLLAETLAENRRRSNLFDSALPLTYALFICEEHQDITSNVSIQNNILTALVSEADQ